ncbi:MAG TPA: type II toxin-antitoxin system antitoxin SocA domain-containing protein [Acidimicrobiales bacterium]
MTVPTAHDVAAMLIEEQTAAGRTIDKLQLQKLLYLVQGAHVAFWGERAFREPILAFQHGPVVASVERSYREAFGDADVDQPLGGDASRLSHELVDTVRTVLRHFGTWTGRNLTSHVKKAGSPWHQARGSRPESDVGRDEISLDAIRSWFTTHGLDPARRRDEVWDATEEERAAADARRRMHGAHSVLDPFEITASLEHLARRSLG